MYRLSEHAPAPGGVSSMETEGGWRMDVDITVQDELDEDNDAEDKIMSENKDERGSESDSETSTPDNI